MSSMRLLQGAISLGDKMNEEMDETDIDMLNNAYNERVVATSKQIQSRIKKLSQHASQLEDSSSEESGDDEFDTPQLHFSNLLETPVMKREKTRVEFDGSPSYDDGTPLPQRHGLLKLVNR